MPRPLCLLLLLVPLAATAAGDEPSQSPLAAKRPRLGDLGISIGVLPTGPTNSLTDVAGVSVGHQTLIQGDSIRTGVTAIIPHPGNVFQKKVPAAIHVANGFGKFVGTTQIEELGVIETPILLTNTLSTFAAADALIGWTLKQPGNEMVKSVNPVVGECNDGYLNEIRKRVISPEDVEAAIKNAHGGAVEEGCVGAGTGVRCMGFKAGIGSSSRKLPEHLGGYTVGVLVQTNFGGSLTIAGVPVGRELGQFYLKDEVRSQEHGSCIVIIATDAPLDARRLKRLAKRAPLGLAAAGSPITHGSGDYVLAFSTAEELQSPYESEKPTEKAGLLRDDRLSPLFQAVRDATEEAVINSILKAVTTTGHEGRTAKAIDPEKVAEICNAHGVVSGIRRSPVRNYAESKLPDSLRAKISQMEEQLPALMKTHHVPGVSVAVVSGRKLVWSRGYGVRCAESDLLVQPDTIMEACSMSKPFFGYLALKLAEKNEFDLDRPLVDYLGKDYLAGDARHRRITARMVLSHTSGLPNWRKGGWRTGKLEALEFEPGSKFRYSGEGFLMLQRAIEKKLGTDLDTFSQDDLIKPLRLSGSRFVWDDRFLVRASCGHDRMGEVKTKRDYFTRANAAYTLYTTAEDYARFLVEILKDDRSASITISETTRQEMLKPVSHREDQDADWGLGWGLKTVQGQRFAYHRGANGTGFRCYAEFCQATGEGLVIMTNALGGEAVWKAIVQQWHATDKTTE